MSNTVSATQFYGLDAWMLEDDALRVVLQPAPGGKLASLYDKRNGVEWLAQPLLPPQPELAYGSAWSGPHSYGWDVMLPTITACPYPGPGPAVGATLPDHGELWTLPWQGKADAEQGAVIMQVRGQALPYTLVRQAQLGEPGELVLSYRLRNDGDLPLLYLWAEHPLFLCEPGAEIVLPEEVREVVNALAEEWGSQWGPPGTINSWPVKRAGAAMHALNQVGDVAQRSGRKFYVRPDQHIGWAALRRPAVNAALEMRWDPHAAPFFGVWVDEGAVYPAACNVALEPASGYYDSLALAAGKGQASVLAPNTERHWQVRVKVEGR